MGSMWCGYAHEMRASHMSTNSSNTGLTQMDHIVTQLVSLTLYYMNVFPPIGLTKRPFRAAFISAYNAGLMPFFLHFFSSASLRLLVSKLLDFQSLLDTDSCDPLPCENPGKAISEGLPEEIVMMELDEFECER